MGFMEGVSASPGMTRGKAVVYLPLDLNFTPRRVKERAAELARLSAAVARSIEELVRLKERVLREMGEEFAHIFRSQQTILEDESIIGEIEEQIRGEGWCAEESVRQVFTTYRQMFEELGDDDYNKERVGDLEDVHARVLRNLLGKEEIDLSDLAEGSILVAEELLPSDTALMSKERVSGMVTEKGGITSHVAILAKNLGIPAAVAVPGVTSTVRNEDTVYLDVTDPEEARVYVNPDQETRRELEQRWEEYKGRRKLLEAEKQLEPVTPDGRRITVSANIGSVEEIEAALEQGARSVGLFRSEFLFMKDKVLPDEETQFAAYKAAVEAFTDGFVILRTLDVGGDKSIDSLSIPREDNPFLGYRAVRISLDKPQLFRGQLRAALRASAFGNLKVMFPMISGPNEVVRIRALLDELIRELDEEGIDYDRSMEVGIMVEIPSAVFMADELLEHVDFMSIGTNDLTQYLLAADRLNEKIRDYYQPFHPAVFRAIARVVDAAHARGKWVGVCGELGGMPIAMPALIGLGVDELSMSAQTLPEAIHIIRRTRYQEAQELANRLLHMDSEPPIKALLQRIAMS
ncbi:MAG: phosphoenolpyruvate--protein phosphotransferase [Alkalispirochaetaceae bacterium]